MPRLVVGEAAGPDGVGGPCLGVAQLHDHVAAQHEVGFIGLLDGEVFRRPGRSDGDRAGRRGGCLGGGQAVVRAQAILQLPPRPRFREPEAAAPGDQLVEAGRVDVGAERAGHQVRRAARNGRGSGLGLRRFLRRKRGRGCQQGRERGGGGGWPKPAPRSHRGLRFARNRPVYEPGQRAISSGVPSATIVPPSSPPSGPRSMTWSAHRMTSRLCSISTMVLPWSTRTWSTSISCFTSAKCRPVVGSSSR